MTTCSTRSTAEQETDIDTDPDYVPSGAVVAMVRRLAARSPSVAVLLQEHEEENDGELLPYLLLADVARWYVDRVEHRDVDPAGSAEARSVSEAIAQEFTDADPGGDVADAVALGFLEPILPFGAAEPPAYVALLPIQLRAEVERMLGG